jgi:hypothetical protein
VVPKLIFNGVFHSSFEGGCMVQEHWCRSPSWYFTAILAQEPLQLTRPFANTFNWADTTFICLWVTAQRWWTEIWALALQRTRESADVGRELWGRACGAHLTRWRGPNTCLTMWAPSMHLYQSHFCTHQSSSSRRASQLQMMASKAETYVSGAQWTQ